MCTVHNNYLQKTLLWILTYFISNYFVWLQLSVFITDISHLNFEDELDFDDDLFGIGNYKKPTKCARQVS